MFYLICFLSFIYRTDANRSAPKISLKKFMQSKAHFKQRHLVPLFENIRFHRSQILIFQKKHLIKISYLIHAKNECIGKVCL